MEQNKKIDEHSQKKKNICYIQIKFKTDRV